MFSRIFLFGNLQRFTVVLTLLALIPATAIAQYGGGMGGMGGGMGPYPTGTHPSYGSKGAVIGGVAGGAAGAGLLYYALRNRATLTGCVGGDGDKLVNEKDNRTYTLTNKGEALRPGERVEVRGKKTKDESGEPVFQVHKMTKDLGSCTPTTAEKR